MYSVQYITSRFFPVDFTGSPSPSLLHTSNSERVNVPTKRERGESRTRVRKDANERTRSNWIHISCRYCFICFGVKQSVSQYLYSISEWQSNFFHQTFLLRVAHSHLLHHSRLSEQKRKQNLRIENRIQFWNSKRHKRAFIFTILCGDGERETEKEIEMIVSRSGTAAFGLSRDVWMERERESIKPRVKINFFYILCELLKLMWYTCYKWIFST